MFRRHLYRAFTAAAAVVCALATGMSAARGAVTATAGHYVGSLTDGASWVADLPASWNGTVILYSHGFGPLTAADAPDAATQAVLLHLGYALVGSSYSGSSWWALSSAVGDQFASLAAVERITGHPRRVIAWGTSMGGLVSALETQDGRGRIDGTLTTCGLVAGALSLNNYQLDGEYALNELLDPSQQIQLVRYASAGQASAAAAALAAIVSKAQATAPGRARIALGAALLNEPVWYSGATAPAPTDYAAQEQQQADEISQYLLPFIMSARYQIELAADGNSSFTKGVNYGGILSRSSFRPEVEALYRAAGLSLPADLATLTRHADITADPQAVAALARTSMVTGRLAVPELDIHTIYDQLVPVEQENWYRQRVTRAGSAPDLRQAYVDATGHCNFQPAGYIAALNALEHRLNTSRWGDATQPDALNAAAAGTGLGAFDPYVRFTPPSLVNARA
ncbi:MAG: alpha/beta hydrolase [Actinobacteria bacterium]|nr:alpha/beta hydrolase [Actinomycetota bacterium]